MKKRIVSIDFLRGLVMVIMALDHVRDYFHFDAFFFAPNDLDQTYPALFWTRFITHFCAPVFVFLAGTSAFFVGQRLEKKALSIWLLKRGLWLIIAEITVIEFAWLFQINILFYDLMVIWVLGASMLFLAVFIYLPKKLAIAICILVIVTHNYFDNFSPTSEIGSIIWTFLHEFKPLYFGDIQVFIAYPLIPWIFLMPLGYYFGGLFLPSVPSEIRVSKLWKMGLSITLFFLILRLLNVYGDAYSWSSQPSFAYTLMSFFNVSKYPPSLLYLLITIGPTLIFLALAEKWENKFAESLVTIGRVPMFYYIVHLYLIHAGAVIAVWLTGFEVSEMLIIDEWITDQSILQGYGFKLWIVYIIWIVLVLALYPLCKWYDTYKGNNRHKWWLSYL